MEQTKIIAYKAVYQGGQAEIIEKKSRFIATVKSVETEEEAVSFINEMKKKYWDARHNCSAFVIGSRQELTRCSDDGEPAQTAGRPMLDVLLKEGVTNVAVVVTRYFGGVLLGTGGLVRAYRKATQEGLAASVVIEKQEGFLLYVTTDYVELGKLQYLFAQKEISVLDTEYGADVVMQVLVPVFRKQEMEKAITEQTNGTAVLEWGDSVMFALIDKKAELF
uniref:YigZ family protein n=1 Tax=Agathobacter sp. TaxID=2021311 RepID=UPI004055D325